ncbi:type II secretion system protein [Mobilitalea sibirica]|uniref:Type II secretion system protein n=1 Tax=Mobilitalea sibirica TaxID=1462919 RepID=A0A8J7H0T8_9FIRM|nr:type II secretion system protein [Mobilitalea sibirica]MBH1939782.1 type II secretion system protein [Mobilitalea sibirica]
MKSLKENNKGFSLVELIVVIAIMGILAVTLAPRLTQYIERARLASDQEAVNTIFTAAKLANVENPIGDDQELELGWAAPGAGDPTSMFTVSADGDTWTLVPEYLDQDATDGISQAFLDDMKAVLGNFELKSTNVEPFDATPEIVTQIILSTDSNGNVSVLLDYDGDGSEDGEDYSVSE